MFVVCVGVLVSWHVCRDVHADVDEHCSWSKARPRVSPHIRHHTISPVQPMHPGRGGGLPFFSNYAALLAADFERCLYGTLTVAVSQSPTLPLVPRHDVQGTVAGRSSSHSQPWPAQSNLHRRLPRPCQRAAAARRRHWQPPQVKRQQRQEQRSWKGRRWQRRWKRRWRRQAERLAEWLLDAPTSATTSAAKAAC